MSRRRSRKPAARPAVQLPIDAAPSPVERKRWLKGVLLAVAVCLPALLAYSNSFHAGFTLDNEFIILGNPALQAATSADVGLILEHTYWWPTTTEVGLYRPVTTLSYLLNYSVFGNQQNPFGYHLLNLLLHCLNVILVYLLAERFIRSAWLPELIAMAWAVHPVLTESVTNIVGRADLLAGASILGGFLLYLKSTESSGWARVGSLAGLCAITFVGVFSKESAVALLGVVILYEVAFWRGKKSLRAAAWGCVAIVIPILCLLYERARLLAIYFPQPPSYLDNPLFGAGFIEGKLTAIAVMSRYIWKLAWPATLSADYSYNQIPLVTGSLRDWIAWGVVGAVLAAAVILFKRNKTAFFFLTFAFVVFVPTSNLLFNIGTIMAERFLYLPAVGFTVCLALAINALSERVGVRGLAPIAMIVIMGAWGIRTCVRNNDWRDSLTLAIASVKTSPQSYKTHAVLAYQLYNSSSSASRIDASLTESEVALTILKDIPDERNEITPYFNAQTEYREKGDLSLEAEQSGVDRTNPPESRLAYQRAVEILLQALRINNKAAERQEALDPEGPTPELQFIRKATPHLYFQLAQTYLNLGEADEAYRTALYTRALSPKVPDISLLASEAAASAGHKDEAAVALVAGLLVTEDKSLLTPLDSLYRNGLDPKGCAFMNAGNSPVLNNSCEPVHSEICEAYADIIQIMKWESKPEVAEQTKSLAVKQYGCTEQVLAEGKKIQEFP